MKKLSLTFVFCLTVFLLSAQDIKIDFQPKVAGTPIDSIRATNLRTNQTAKLLGSESLVLVKTPTGINPVLEIIETSYIYPNPTDKDATFCYSMNKSEEVEISMYNTNGQLLTQNKLFLEQGTHRFELKFPLAGIYFLSVLKNEESASYKVIYTGRKIQESSVFYSGSEKSNSEKPNVNWLKSETTDKSLAYSDGDIIQYSVSSGAKTTIITETPTVSKAINVEFVNCTDKDGKSYKVVKIGSQWWMAENLAYLPEVSPIASSSKTTPKFYVYNYNDSEVAKAKATSNYKTYGVLYNWSAALVACPPGWHLPNDTEWTALINLLGGGSLAGGKLKETGTTHWNSPNTGATNETGFAALPAGYLSSSGVYYPIGFYNIGDYMAWWSSTDFDTANAWIWTIRYGRGEILRSLYSMDNGYSVRCVKD